MTTGPTIVALAEHTELHATDELVMLSADDPAFRMWRVATG